jgi:YHS domain-containing protein
LGDVADTSELFMRSLQMYNLFIDKKSRALPSTTKIKTQPRTITPELEPIENKGITGLEEMKIGTVVRTVLRKILESGELSEDEILKMQTKEYSKETFDIQFPLLLSKKKTDSNRPSRYYATPIRIHGEEYFLCSEWYERFDNNDRPYLMKWLGLKMET